MVSLTTTKRPQGSRKRALARIGIGLAAVGVATSSPFSQLKVGPASREVPYQHTLEKTPRLGPPSRVWVPPGYLENEEDDFLTTQEEESHETQQHRVLEYLEDGTGEMFWSLAVDASLEHPPGAPRVRRRAGPKKSSSLRRGRRRRQQVTDKFVEDSTSAILQEEGTEDEESEQDERGVAPQNSNNNNNEAEIEAEADDDGDLHDNYAGFNVTAEVHYNISEDLNDNSTTSTILTSSEQTDDVTVQAVYQPLRIRAVLSEQKDGGEFLTVPAREYILQEIIRPALLTWSAALRVEPVVGNLTVDTTQLFDSETCGPGIDSGLPSPKVPYFHLTEGIPDTDLILYLSIGFNPDIVDSTEWVTNFTKSFLPPSEPKNENSTMQEVKNETSTSSGTQDDLDLDTLEETVDPHSDRETTENPSAAPSASPDPATKPHFCLGDYVAAASYCSTDQFDRPTAGMLHVCIDDSFFLPQNRNRNIITMRHEIGHVLGFNSRSMAHFRRSDGSPITPRVNGEIVEKEVECSGPRSSRGRANVTLPSQEILKFRKVRGGVRVAEVVTPSVLQVVRNHFDCQTLSGAELESGEYLPLAENPEEQACIGDHWERRLFQNDLMNPVVDSVDYSPFISTITLAYFADSGWYQVDLSMAELAASWGRGAGCSFAEETCIGQDGEVPQPNAPFFCNAAPKTNPSGIIEEINGCTADLSRKAACSLGQYDLELPPEYQYFVLTYGATVGGNDPFIDYCPTYTGFSNGLCSDSENEELIKVDKIEQFGRRNSRCLASTTPNHQTALCLPIACVVEDRSLRVKVGKKWKTCARKDQRLKFRKNKFVTCPDPRRICPTFFCSHDCLGTPGRCDYDSGACVCSSANTAGTAQTTGHDSANDDICSWSGEQQEHFTDSDRDKVQRPPLMPHEDSPLSDYYVQTRDSLQDDSYHSLAPWGAVAVVGGMLLLVLALLWSCRRKRVTEETNQGGGGNDDAPPPVADPNKHKMIATVLVDMRMNGPGGSSIAPTAASSLCPSERDSSASVQPSLGPSLEDDRSSLASEDVLADVDQFDRKPQSEVRKRRFAHF